MPGSRLVEFGHKFPNFTPSAAPYLQDLTVNAALDATMIDAGFNWCQRCQVLALHTPENVNDNLKPIDLLRLCYRGDGSSNEFGQFHSEEDSNLLSWQLPSVPPGTVPPDRDLRLDASTCQTCPGQKMPDENGQCTLDCPADLVIDGRTAPFGATTDETGTSSILNTVDGCPGLFVLEIDNPDQFFARGAATVAGSVTADTPSAQSCAPPFSLTFADSPASSTGFVSEQTVTSPPNSFAPAVGLAPAACSGAPKITITSARLTNGSAAVRFVTPVLPNVSFTLDVETAVAPAK